MRHFLGTINLGFYFAEDKRNDINVALMLKRCTVFVKQTDPNFRIDSLNGSAQCISNPSHIHMTKDGVEMEYAARSMWHVTCVPILFSALNIQMVWHP
jgi:hypothetical protein